ncbi:MAG: hypothetical protein NC225_01125 [Clostridium sp.]|nr:hypothetical protein [Clostridium sp.]MCM1459302.1 hypothetical protein [Bacteroides sp.]
MKIRKIGISICLLAMVLVFCGNTVGARAIYNGTAKVKVTSRNFIPFATDKAEAYCYACVEGNRFTNRKTNSRVSGEGYIFYYSPKIKGYTTYKFNGSKTITKSGEKFVVIERTGKSLDRKYKDVYAMSIHCVFKLKCNKCGACETRIRNAIE